MAGRVAVRPRGLRAQLDVVPPQACPAGATRTPASCSAAAPRRHHGVPRYRAAVLEAIDIDGTRANGYLFQIETAFRLSDVGAVITELPITFVDRVAGNSKMAVVRTMVETELRVTWWGICPCGPRG